MHYETQLKISYENKAHNAVNKTLGVSSTEYCHKLHKRNCMRHGPQHDWTKISYLPLKSIIKNSQTC